MKKVPLNASKLIKKVVQLKLDNEDAVDMSSYVADWAQKRFDKYQNMFMTLPMKI